jgi:hypothetical protein
MRSYRSPRSASAVLPLVCLACLAGCEPGTEALESITPTSSALTIGGVTVRPPPATASPSTTVQGVLGQLTVGRRQSGGGPGGTRSFVTTAERRIVEVQIPAAVARAAGGHRSLLGKNITVTGTRAAADQPLVATLVTAPAAAQTPAPAQQLGTKRWVNLLCRFGDLPSPTPHGPAYFQQLMSMANPGLGDYWSRASGARLTVDGGTVVDWMDLPRSAAEYQAMELGERIFELILDCVFNAEIYAPEIDFSQVDGIALAFSHNLESQIVGSAAFPLFVGGTLRSFPLAVYSPVEITNQAAVARTMGIGMGLRFSGSAPLTFDSPWDVMSRGYAVTTTGQCRTITPAFGCAAVFPAGDHAAALGWAPAATVPRNSSATHQLQFAGEMPVAGRVGVLRVAIDANRYQTIEARRQDPASYDRGVPHTGLVVQTMSTRPLPDEPTDNDLREFSTPLRFVQSLADGTAAYSTGDLDFTFTRQPWGYVVTSAPPPPPEPEPDPPEEEEEGECYCPPRMPAHTCEYICGNGGGL